MKELEIRPTCPDCGVKIGEYHQPNCDVELCPLCGQQMLQDTCVYAYFDINAATLEQHLPDIYQNGLPDEMLVRWDEHIQPSRLVWDGVWPGVRECREYDFWCKMTRNGWQPCSVDDPEAVEDLNELVMHSHWDREAKRFVVHEKEHV